MISNVVGGFLIVMRYFLLKKQTLNGFLMVIGIKKYFRLRFGW